MFFSDIVKDCPTIRNLPKIFLRSFENVAPDASADLMVPDMSLRYFCLDSAVTAQCEIY